jgi:hypothetical protein
MHRPPYPDAVKNGRGYPLPPRLHWAVLLFLLASSEALAFWLFPEPYRNFAVFVIAAAWPTYLCLWVRRIDHRASSLYWAIASLVTGFGFLFSWLLYIVVIFELREELLDHYNRREPIGIRLNWFLTILFSFVYFQYALNKIAIEKQAPQESAVAQPEGSVPA